jgi:hypothetical protein
MNLGAAEGWTVSAPLTYGTDELGTNMWLMECYRNGHENVFSVKNALYMYHYQTSSEFLSWLCFLFKKSLKISKTNNDNTVFKFPPLCF